MIDNGACSEGFIFCGSCFGNLEVACFSYLNSIEQIQKDFQKEIHNTLFQWKSQYDDRNAALKDDFDKKIARQEMVLQYDRSYSIYI